MVYNILRRHFLSVSEPSIIKYDVCHIISAFTEPTNTITSTTSTPSSSLFIPIENTVMMTSTLLPLTVTPPAPTVTPNIRGAGDSTTLVLSAGIIFGIIIIAVAVIIMIIAIFVSKPISSQTVIEGNEERRQEINVRTPIYHPEEHHDGGRTVIATYSGPGSEGDIQTESPEMLIYPMELPPPNDNISYIEAVELPDVQRDSSNIYVGYI